MNTNYELWESDAVKIHELYAARGGEYGRTGGFGNPGPLRAIDTELWKECRDSVTGCKTLSERIERYRV